MSDSILTSVKKILGIDDDYTAFDLDIITHINSVFSTLHSLGVGPELGFAIEDKTAVWSDFLGGDLRLNSVKTYMSLRVRLLFDPPATSFHIQAMNEQVREFEWRINSQRESVSWVSPDPLAEDDEQLVLDGGLP